MSKTPKINHPYTPAQLRDLIDKNTAEALELQGYVLQYDVLTNTYRIVHALNASAPFRQDGPQAKRGMVHGTSQDWGELPPIVKRKPADRVDSMMARWIKSMKEHGGIPTLQSGIAPAGSTQAERDEAKRRKAVEEREMEAKIQEIVGAAWVAGRTEITADVVRQVASHFLQDAENKQNAADFKKVTRSAS